MKYACNKCQRFFHIKRNGVLMEEGLPVGPAKRADNQAMNWLPYKLFLADIYECPKCKTELVVSALRPVAEHFQAEYDQLKEQYKAMGALLPMVEDC